MRYFIWKLELVSIILWVVIEPFRGFLLRFFKFYIILNIFSFNNVNDNEDFLIEPYLWTINVVTFYKSFTKPVTKNMNIVILSVVFKKSMLSFHVFWFYISTTECRLVAFEFFYMARLFFCSHYNCASKYYQIKTFHIQQHVCIHQLHIGL